MLFRKPDEFVITDEVSGPPGLHDIEQFWHFGVAVEQIAPSILRAGSGEISFLAEDTVQLMQGGEHGWRSQALRCREEAPVAYCRCLSATLPTRFVTRIKLRPAQIAI